MARGQPLYQRIRDDLEGKIKNGHYKKGEYIPSEEKLVINYNASRTTIRNAIRELVSDGYLTIVRGKGTKVTSSKLSDNIPNLISFTEIIKQQGLKPSTLEIRLGKIRATEKIAEKLDIDVDEEVLEIYRVRAVDDEPIAINQSFIPCKFIETFDMLALKKRHSLYKILKEDFNISIEMSIDNISAISADAYTAKTLNIVKGDPLLYIDRVAYDQNNNAIDYSKVIYRGDRYSHAIIMRKNQKIM